jgi:hypothetical protein
MGHHHPVGIAGKTMVVDDMVVSLFDIQLTGAVD